jgi:hypothetical protein
MGLAICPAATCGVGSPTLAWIRVVDAFGSRGHAEPSHQHDRTTPVAPDKTGDYCAVRMTKASVFSS